VIDSTGEKQMDTLLLCKTAEPDMAVENVAVVLITTRL
jgi:hypothetical protein